MVAALYLIKSISESSPKVEIRLFEGFVLFKSLGTRSDHLQDVKLLKEVIDNPSNYADAIISEDAIKMNPTDSLQSAFLVMGIDAGIPPIIMPYASVD